MEWGGVGGSKCNELVFLAGICLLTQKDGPFPKLFYYCGISCLLDWFIKAETANKTRQDFTKSSNVRAP